MIESALDIAGECRTTGDAGHCLVAIVLDNRVLLSPEVQQAINGPARITGDFGREEASLVAAQLAHGSQPLLLEVGSIER